MAIKNHAMLNSYFNERDAKIMKHLVRIQCSKSYLPVPKINVNFEFKHNVHMENLHLYFTAVKNIDTNDTMEVIGSNVQWKEG